MGLIFPLISGFSQHSVNFQKSVSLTLLRTIHSSIIYFLFEKCRIDRQTRNFLRRKLTEFPVSLSALLATQSRHLLLSSAQRRANLAASQVLSILPTHETTPMAV